MYPPIFAVCFASAEVKSFLGSAPLRLAPFGETQQGTALPYAVWSVISGSPDSYIGEAPDIDAYSLQVDVYASNATSARDTAKALRDAIQPHAYITAWLGESREPDTNLYRFIFSVDWLVPRA